MTVSTTTARVTALRIVPEDGGPANLRQLITQGPVSRAPHTAGAAAIVRGASAITIAPRRAAARALPELRVVSTRPKTPPPAPHETSSEDAARDIATRSVNAATGTTNHRSRLVAGAIGLSAILVGMLAWITFEPTPATTEGPAPNPTSANLGANLGAVVPASAESPPAAEAPQPAAAPRPSSPEESDLVILLEDEALAEEPTPTEPSLVARRPVPRTRRTQPAQQMEQLLDDAGVALAIGDRTSAVSTFEEVLERRPHSATAAAGLSAAHFDNGRFDLAAHYANEAVKSGFAKPDHHVLLGDAYYRLGMTDDAHVQWSTAVKLGSDRAARRLSKEL